MLNRLDALLDNLAGLTVQADRIAEDVITAPATRDIMIELNRLQLYSGLRSDDSRTDTAPGRPYAPSTVLRKKRKGQPSDRVTLKDTGAFYERIRVRNTAGLLEIWNENTQLLKSLQERYGDKIMGLSADSMDRVRELKAPEIKERLWAYLKQQ